MAHPTRWVELGTMGADVDEDLADAVLELWRAGIDTASACQDEGDSIRDTGRGDPAWVEHTANAYAGRSYVDFVSLDDVRRFYDLVANAGERDGVYERMAHPAAPGAWEVRVTVYDALPSTGTGDWSDPSSFAVGVVRVRFPRTDATAIADRLRRANSGQRGPHTEPSWSFL